MSATKRDHSSDASESRATCAKVVKTSRTHDSAAGGRLSAQQHSEDVRITVGILSQYGEKEDNNGPGGDTSDEDSDISIPISDREPNLMKHINGFAHVGKNWVAGCNAKLLRRGPMRTDFWDKMDDLSEETSVLSFELFDRYGRLNREYCEHDIRKGSGVWDKELDRGDILLIEYIHIQPHLRRQGVGTKLVSAVLDKARHMSERFFAFASPMHLTRDLDSDDEKLGSSTVREQSKEFYHFFRSLGFRRVGTSGWLAFTDNDSHPSRHLDKAQDWDDPERSKKEQTVPEPIRTILSSLSDPSTSGVECVYQMEQVLAVEEDAPLWLYVNEVGETILHVAAIGRKAEPISYIMSKHPRLAEKRNADGYTPLEALQSSLELQRTRPPRAKASDSFIGFRQSDIACLAALTGTEIFDLDKLSDRDIWAVSSATDEMASRVREVNLIRNTLRLKYGCTCGQCIGGLLSPRMHLALLCQAEYQHDILDDYPGSDCSGHDWVKLNDDVLGYLPRAVQQNLTTNKSMREGFINMCGHIASCLRKNRLPNTETILDFYREEVSEWPPVTRNYLQRGGTVAAVAMMLFDMAINWDEWAGDGILMETEEDRVNKLPTCRNDHEFIFVRNMCGYEGDRVVVDWQSM
ncbi:hypothetical protein F4679DRAFT_567890 [Xylaria curta]|nr:hypothetical protein F4679DRAFT_567890 [Xylaria curta]